MNLIPLTQGHYARVDAEDFDTMSAFSWSCSKSNGGVYAVRGIWNSSEKRTVIVPMHRVIVGASRGQYVDHINNDTLDNRRCNLRICTNSQNHGNRPPQSGRVTKGVHLTKRRSHLANPWHAYITVAGKRIHLGYFTTEREAQDAYNEAALFHFGEFAQVVS